jgi:hypothetical protein
MALFSDGKISTVESLTGYESTIFDVARTEHIDLTKKLTLAQQEMEVELTAFLLRHAKESSSEILTNRLGVDRVVVTSALRQWHTFHTLALVYRDAYNSHLNDRFLGKWHEYERLARWASTRSFEIGIGMVYEAIPKASPPGLGSVTGNLPEAMYWVRVAWTSITAEEGCPSEPSVLRTSQGSRLVVEAQNPPCVASGWNVYAGLSADETTLQNSVPLPIGSGWVMPDSGLEAGKKATEGQVPAYFLAMNRTLQRG